MKRIGFLVILILVVLSSCQNNQPIKIFTIGDSTMANKKEDVYPETGWCQVLDQYFDETVTVENHALNGRSSKSFINEGRWQAVLDSLQPNDYVFIQFGHNDQKYKDSTRFTIPFETYSENLEMFVNESREKGANPILFTSIIRRKFENGELIDTHGDYPVATRQVAEKLNVPLIDLQKITEKWVNDIGDEQSKTMFLWTEPNEKFPEGRKDDTHLSEEGANEIARSVVAEINSQGLELSKRIK